MTHPAGFWRRPSTMYRTRERHLTQGSIKGLYKFKSQERLGKCCRMTGKIALDDGVLEGQSLPRKLVATLARASRFMDERHLQHIVSEC
jgi:hypothetical protein